jgi:hypothetical protein
MGGVLLDNGKNSNSVSLLINDNKGAFGKLGIVLAERSQDEGPEVIGENILTPHLDYARPGRMRQRERRAEVEVMRENNVLIRPRPIHDFPV